MRVTELPSMTLKVKPVKIYFRKIDRTQADKKNRNLLTVYAFNFFIKPFKAEEKDFNNPFLKYCLPIEPWVYEFRLELGKRMLSNANHLDLYTACGFKEKDYSFSLGGKMEEDIVEELKIWFNENLAKK